MLDKIGVDGYKHIIISTILTVGLKLFLPTWMAILIVLSIGIGKEIYDKISNRGHSELKDLICDIIGILIGVL